MKRDMWSGLVLASIGAGAIFEGKRHSIGTLRDMGAGYFPIALGTILVVLGLVMAGLAWNNREAGTPEEAPALDLRGAVCIVAGVIAFIGLGGLFGLAPGTFACVSIAALGDRGSRPREVLGLAVVMTAFAVILFAWLLQVPFPILQWLT